MSDTSDQPTRKSDPPPSPTPYEGETHDAPPAPEPGTVSALTHSNTGDPRTASLPPAGTVEPFAEPPGYLIVRELGSGGMGVVYEVRQTRLNRLVALKVLRGGRSNAQDVIRFLREAEAVAAIKHPHVVQVYDFGQHAGGPFMALELLTGGTLSDRLRRDERLPPRDAAELVVKLAEAVQAAHDLGIVHRDLKPGNVLFDEANVPKVTDFGLAKRGTADLTRTQALMGTPAYMAPEQARGDSKFVGPPADVWALGAILYECLTGKRAFEADDTWAVLRKVTDEAPPAPRTHVLGLPRDLELIALKCLEKSPADRYPSAAALAEDLGNYLAGRPVIVRPAGPLERFTKWTKRNPAIAGATVAVALALLVGSAVSLAFGIQAARRGDDLAKANGELSRTNDDLTHSRDEERTANAALKETRNTLTEQTLDLINVSMRAQTNGYLSDISLAHQLWKANDLIGMRAVLERCPPGLRQWEWVYLDRISRPEKEVIATDSTPLALVYSPDGKRLAHLTRAGTLTVHELATGRTSLFTTDFPSGFNRVLAFRPDGQEIAFAVGSRYWIAKLNGRQVKELTPMKDGQPANSHAFVALGYTKDGRLLGATSSLPKSDHERTFVIHDVAAEKTIATLQTGIKSPLSVVTEVGGTAFSPDGTRFAACVVDSGIRIGGVGKAPKFEPFRPALCVWDVASEKRLHQAEGGSGLFQQLAFAPDGKAVGYGQSGQVGELAIGADWTLRVFGRFSGEVRATAFDRAGLIWSAGDDKFIVAHDRKTGTERLTLRGCPNGVYRLAISPDGKEIAAAEGDLFGGGSVRRFDLTAAQADVWRSSTPRDHVNLVAALSHDASRFAAASFSTGGAGPEATRFLIREVNGGAERRVESPGQWIHGAFRPDGSLIVLDSERLRFVSKDGKPGAELALPADRNPGTVPNLACSPNGQTFAAVIALKPPEMLPGRQSQRARLLTWNAETLKAGPTATVDLSAVAPPDVRGQMVIPTRAAFDAEGRRLAASFTIGWEKSGRGQVEFRGVVVVWDATTGKELFQRVTTDPLRTVGFDPQGHVVAGGGNATSGLLMGWDIVTGAEVLSLRGHTRPILSFAFGLTAQNGRLVTGGADRTVKVWDIASRREILTFDGFVREVTQLAFTPTGNDLVVATGIDLLAAMMAGSLQADWPPAEVRIFRGPK